MTEKKTLPVWQVFKHKELAAKIAELTEDLEELRSEKVQLLQQFDYAGDAGAEVFRKDITAMEASLQKLAEKEQKYSAELKKALEEYAEAKAEAAGLYPVELMEARLAMRPDRERTAISRVQSAYGDRYDPQLMSDSKLDAARLLNEETAARSIHERLSQSQKVRTQYKRQPSKHNSWEW